MASRFLIDNRWLLKLCSDVARFFGLLALLGTGVLLALFIALGRMAGESVPAASRGQLTTVLPAIAFYGFFALVFAEFLSYLLADEGEPKWILRHGHQVVYAYVVYFVAATVYIAWRTSNTAHSTGMDSHRILTLSLLVGSTAIKALIWIGIGIVLQKVVPIIRESKTLV